MASIDELKVNFHFMDIEAKNDILEKCLELCSKYEVSAEDLVDQWSAFAASHFNTITPTLAALELMEHRELIKQQQQLRQKRRYLKTEVKPALTTEAQTPETVKSKKRHRSPEDDKENLPSTSALNISESFTYHNRSNPLKVLLSTAYTTKNISRNYNSAVSVCVKQYGPQSNWLSVEAKYMFEKPKIITTCINEIIEYLGHSLIKKYKLENPQGILQLTGNIVTFGRICCNPKGKLKPTSIQLEYSVELGQGNRISLNLSKLPSYALFPGQVVAAVGEVIHGNTVVAHELYSNVTLPLSLEEIKIPDTLEMIIAAAPFTFNHNIAYEPLQDLLKYAAEKKPHLLVLTGPLLDESHENLTDECLLESYDSLFNNLIDCIMTTFKDLTTQVVIVASQKEIFHVPVYPTPPYVSKNKYPNLHFVPDPSMLDIGGLIVGVTATDVLFQMSREEISLGRSGDRMSRLVSHLIEQQSFYPLIPPKLRVSYRLLEKHATMDVTPHLLILPSTLRYFIKDIYNACSNSLSKAVIGEDDESLTPCLNNTEDKTFSLVLLMYTFLGPILCLVALGILKGILGLCCCPVIGMYGLGLLVQLPRPLDQYQEKEFRHCPVQYDELGWPVNPYTGMRTVRAISKRSEFFLNTIFFLAFPLATCCKICNACCNSSSNVEKIKFDVRSIPSKCMQECRRRGPSKMEKKKKKCRLPKPHVYSDSDTTEASDTKYVLEQLRKSEQSLKNCTYFDNA
ncbi:DNA polymerase alpha subunit B isoform X4 [Agrilus planipennis]|uniref:DNA polymerase alpha subunit B n=1 Tax=Agrilus planipennis TaxID=224129 RepID=A0A7F5R3L3_AGRPL|nr:DNA polymerase alpha subunit B isoform X3 [Agrilus planipennis]XP_025830238.1 DNA polymerase alpha subunit B isoform X4 [Agrilus planipennis]